MFRLLGLVLVVIIVLNGLFASTSAYCKGSYDLCQNGVEVDYPFYAETFSECGYPGLSIKCVDDRHRAAINISRHLYFVQSIDYEKKRVRVVDADIDEEECPQPRQNLSFQSAPSLHYYEDAQNITIFYNCTSYPEDVEILPCLDNYYNNITRRSFAYYSSRVPKGLDWYRNCEKSVVALVSSYSNNTKKDLKSGFDLSWSTPNGCEHCEGSGGQCSFSDTKTGPACSCKDGTRVVDGICPRNRASAQGILTGVLKVVIGIVSGVGVVLLILLVVYRRIFYTLYNLIISNWRNKIKGPTNVEIFLESCGRLPVQRYRYTDIKKMTRSFKEKLGQGGYGSVFRGKLWDGRLVAVKVLNESKGNGEDFINEVTTIGRTNHVNVVSLLGFCTRGTKRAIVYEFMANGSLERFIYNEKNSNTTGPHLGWEKLYQIVLGIARGLDYLHRGCNTLILHLDIKPHNILLDQDFCPKISDFGLAKLCPTRESVVSMTGPRGTMGYIAPEVLFKNFGGVSHKSDVYSYGMMVLEMIGGRQNIDPTVENMSDVYIPQWIYNHCKNDIEVEGSSEIFEVPTKKMAIVALWCIQTQPRDRPSIGKVVEMLEGNTEDLQMPPNPF